MAAPKRKRENQSDAEKQAGSQSHKRNAAVVVQQPKRPEPGSVAVSSSGFHRLDEETIQYFQEVKSHFDTLEDAEEQALLVQPFCFLLHPTDLVRSARNRVREACMQQVGNVLEDMAGKEVKVCTDAACSRILEALLPAAQAQQLAAFLGAFFAGEGEAFCELCAR